MNKKSRTKLMTAIFATFTMLLVGAMSVYATGAPVVEAGANAPVAPATLRETRVAPDGTVTIPILLTQNPGDLTGLEYLIGVTDGFVITNAEVVTGNLLYQDHNHETCPGFPYSDTHTSGYMLGQIATGVVGGTGAFLNITIQAPSTETVGHVYALFVEGQSIVLTLTDLNTFRAEANRVGIIDVAAGPTCDCVDCPYDCALLECEADADAGIPCECAERAIWVNLTDAERAWAQLPEYVRAWVLLSDAERAFAVYYDGLDAAEREWLLLSEEERDLILYLQATALTAAELADALQVAALIALAQYIEDLSPECLEYLGITAEQAAALAALIAD